jgi:hypothetical protein
MLAMLLGCGLRRSELVGLEIREVQTRQGHWAIVDLIGKGRRVRTVPIPQWAKRALDRWITAAGITDGRIFRAVTKRGKVWGKGISQNVVWYVVRDCCKGVGLEHIAPHDLRRTCAKLCHSGGGELEQIQFLLGHASVQTTERYLGCKQNLGHPVNDRFTLDTVIASHAPESLNEAAPLSGKTTPEAHEIEGGQQLKYAGGGPEHGDLSPAGPRFLLCDAQPEMVIDRKGNCSQGLRASAPAGVGYGNPINKTNSGEDQASVRTVGTGALPHATPEGLTGTSTSTQCCLFSRIDLRRRLDAKDFQGLAEDKLAYIRREARHPAA